jgi:hypothetical protein
MSHSLYLRSSLAIPPIFDMLMGLMAPPGSEQTQRTNAYLLMTALVERRAVTFARGYDDVPFLAPPTLSSPAARRRAFYQYFTHYTYYPAAIRLAREENDFLPSPLSVSVEGYDPATEHWETIPFATIRDVVVGLSFAAVMTDELERQFAHPVEARAYQLLAGEG